MHGLTLFKRRIRGFIFLLRKSVIRIPNRPNTRVWFTTELHLPLIVLLIDAYSLTESC